MKKTVEDFKNELYANFEQNKYKYKNLNEFVDLMLFNLENDTNYEIDDPCYSKHKELNELMFGVKYGS